MRTLFRRTALVVAAALAMLLISGTTPANAKIWAVGQADYSSDPMRDLSEYEKRILIKINKIRANRGLRKVKYFQSCVDGYSERWVKHLTEIKDLRHRDQMTIIRDCNFTWAGETLARGTGMTPGATVRAWMNSRSHRDVIMKRRADRAGVGVAKGSDGKHYAVLNFGDA